MGYYVEESGFTRVEDLAQSVIGHMVLAGFQAVYPATVTDEVRSVVLKAGELVDPLHQDQPWMIKLMWDNGADDVAFSGAGGLDIIVATDMQFTSDAHAKYRVFYGTPPQGGVGSGSVGVPHCVPGLIGTALYRGRQTSGGPMEHDAGYGDRTFIDRRRLTLPNEELAYPLSYRMSVSPRGFALSVVEDGHDREANRSSWLVVQRPVDNKTGNVYLTGKAPLHCMYGLMKFREENTPWIEESHYNIRRFVVREADVHVPYPLIPITNTWPSKEVEKNCMGVDATQHTRDYNMVINAAQQVGISENNKYIITFPNGFNTARYSYAHELDMLAYTSADVVSEGTVVPVTVYGEAQPRKYMAMHANGPNNTGMRLLMLMEGGGVQLAPGFTLG